MAGEDWQRLADYVVARRVELGMRDRRALAEATGVTERTLGKLENGQHVSPSTLGMVENRLGWAPGSCRRILAGGEPKVGSPDLGQAEHEDPTLWHIASTPGLPPDVVRGLVALARNWRQGDDGADQQASGTLDRQPPGQLPAPGHDKRMLDPNFVLDQGSRERLITRFGAGVDAWCAALPAMVEMYCLRWHLGLDKALSGNSSRVFIGRQHGNRGVVLKLTPDRGVANEEAMALRAWAATPHAVDLLDADLEAGALLLEDIEPGTKVSDEPEIPPVNEVAELLTGLRETADYDAGQLPTLVQGMESMFSRIGGLLSNPRVSSLVARRVLDDGYYRARKLAGNGPRGLLHGDLHLSNILRGGRSRGLVAIDPRPGVGDLTFDAIDWTLDRATSIAEVHERIERLCQLVPGLDPDRLWGWCQATAAALATLRLRRRPPDATTRLLLEIAPGT